MLAVPLPLEINSQLRDRATILKTFSPGKNYVGSKV